MIVSPQGRYRKEIKEDGSVQVPFLFPELRHLTLRYLLKLNNIICLFEEKQVLSGSVRINVGSSTTPTSQRTGMSNTIDLSISFSLVKILLLI